MSRHGTTFLYFPAAGGFATRHGRTHRLLYHDLEREITGDPETLAPSIAPDGRTVAYTDKVGTTSAIFVVSTGGGSPQLLTAPSGRFDYSRPVWSPDGRKIAFIGRSSEDPDQDNAVFVINADGRGERLLARDANEVAWSPDGERLVVGPGLRVVDIRGKVIRSLDPELAGGRTAVGFGLAWGPGKKILYAYDRGNRFQTKCED